MRRTTWRTTAVAGALVLAGCGAGVEPGAGQVSATPTLGATTPATTAPSAATAAPTGPEPTMTDDQPPPRQQPPPSSTGAVPEPYLERVIADASDRSGLPGDRLDVTRAQAVQWRDGSLGCPEPGMMYTQAIVDGYWVELAAGGQRFDYRLDGRGNFRLCQQPTRESPYPDR